MIRMPVFTLFIFTGISGLFAGGDNKLPPLKHEASWADGLVWYQIFPERFRNGDLSDDPGPSEIPETGGFPGWRVSPWTSDWYEMQPWEKAQADSFYSPKAVFARRYGGDLIGVIEKLDYLKELGVGGIYFNPIFEAPSSHKYDAASFHHVDDNFGPDAAGDRKRLKEARETEDPSTWIWTSADSTFLKLIREAHKRGMRVIIDGVFNHSGTTFFAFQDVLENKEKSRYINWYEVLSWDDPETAEDELDYKCWWGYKTLPEFAEDENGLLPGPRDYIFNITRRWMDPNGDGDTSDGIDGWRLDVINEVALPFWEKWSALVDSINPGAMTVAEIWDDASEWIKAGGIDNTMNYLFARSSVDFFIDRQTGLSGQEFAGQLNRIIDLYGKDRAHILWNLFVSHDTDRLASMIINPERDFDRDNRPYINPDYKVRKPNDSERKIQKQMTAFQMTMIGAPMIYYGEEAGLWGADDPDDRKPMLWPDLVFDDEMSHPLPGHTRPDDRVAFDQDLFNYYKGLIQLRHRHAVLMEGDFSVIDGTVENDVIAFTRNLTNQQAVCVFNRNDNPLNVKFPASVFRFRKYRDVFSDRLLDVDEKDIELDVDGRWYVILISE